MAQDTSQLDAGALRARIAGDVHLPGDAGYEPARQPWNLTADPRPAAVVEVAAVDDVVAALAAARAAGLRVAAQSTGHAATALPALDDVLLIRTGRLDSVAVDPAARRARIGAGAQWGAVGAAAAEHGLACLSGSSPTVGVVGFTLGGGVGWLSRAHGLACNSVTAVELVTAAGERVRAAADEEPELFWALRGGGGGFGVVTEIEIELHPVAEAYAGMIAWPAERGPEVLAAYREWIAGLPETVTSAIRYLTLPPLPEVPEPLRARPLVDVTAAFAGGEAEGAELLAPLRALGDPIVDTYAAVPTADLCRINGDPEDPVPGFSDGGALGELSEAAAAALTEAAGPNSGSCLLATQVRHLGGAAARAGDGAGALAALPGEMLFNAVGVPSPAAGPEKVVADIDRVIEALAPFGSGRYFNFADRPASASDFFEPAVLDRLAAVRAAVDPERMLVAPHAAPAVA